MKRYKSLHTVAQVLLLSVASVGMSVQSVAAAEPNVVIEAHGVRITHIDLEAELQKAPVEVRNGMLFRKESLGQLASNLLMRRVLAKQAEAAKLDKLPMNEATLQMARDRVLSDIQLTKLDEQNKPTIAVLDERAKDVYKAEPKRFEIAEEVKVSHILIAKGEGAKEKAQAIIEEIKAGKSFSELAKEKSVDPGSAAKGGDLGMFGRGRMVKQFEDAAFLLKVGEISDVVETQFGFHVLKVTERKEAGMRPYDDVRETLHAEMLQKILGEARVKAGQQIMNQAKSNPAALDAFIASQKPKD